jgi:hypothetical protein
LEKIADLDIFESAFVFADHAFELFEAAFLKFVAEGEQLACGHV